jgi:lipoprotein-releasing system ATP-binding protein
MSATGESGEGAGLITVTGLHKSFGRAGAAVKVLCGIDLKIDEGETVAVLGASGVGKSTLLNIMGALDVPTAGTVYYRDKLITGLADNALAAFRNSFVGFVFQAHHLLPEFTAVENVMLPALIGGVERKEAETRAADLLSEVGLAERLTHKPGELSGGEQQRTAIVRALIQEPRVILADEPTGNLDTKTADEVFDLLLSINRTRKTAMVIVTHNEKLASKMSRRIMMVDGLIEATK